MSNARILRLRLQRYLRLMLGIAVYVFLLFQTAVAKPPEGIKISVEVGYNGYVALSKVNPVIVNLDNQSAATNLSGDLVLEYNGIEYTTPLNLPTPSKKRLYLYFPCDAWPPYLELRVRTKEYSEQFVLNERDHFRTMESGDASIIVLTQQDGSLGVLNGNPVVHLQRDLYGSPNPVVTSGKAIVSYFNLDEVDINPKFFSRADSIVLADIDYNQVDPLLADALKACVAGGTNLVFSLGLNGAGLAKSPLVEICPLQPLGTEQLSGLGSFGAKYGFSNSSIATFAVGDLQPGATVEAWANNLPAIISNTYGGGTITALAFDYTQMPFKQDDGLVGVFWDSAFQMKHSAGVDDWFVHPMFVDKILSKLAEAKPLTPGFVALFLLAYVALIGPFNFLLLGKLKRKTLVWITIPAIIIAFSYIGMSTGFLYRGADNVTSYFQELHIYPGANFAPYQTEMLVFTAERTRYELEVPDRSAFLYADVPQLPDANPFGRTKSANRMRGLSSGQIDNSTLPIISTTQGKWTQKVYMYQGNMALETDVSANLTAVRAGNSNNNKEELRDLRGTFNLDLPFDLYNCYLFAPHYTKTNIGNLVGKGSYSLPDLQGNLQGALSQDNYLAPSIGELATHQKRGVEMGLNYRDEILLVGFSDQISTLAEFDKPHVEHRLSMVVIHLPYKPIIPTQGEPAVSRTRLAGGAMFEPYDPFGYSYSHSHSYGNQAGSYQGESYRVYKDGFIDIEYELAGTISFNSKMLLNLFGPTTPSNNEDIFDVFPYMRVLVSQGKGWQELTLRSDSRQVDVPVSGSASSSRTVKVRIIAREEFAIPLPKASFY